MTTKTPSGVKVKGNGRVKLTAYIANVVKRKALMMWVPHDMEEFSPIQEFAYYLEYVEGIKPIDTLLYDNDFTNFYGFEITDKYDNTINPGHYFCSSDENGGVNEDYIAEAANDPNTVTILSVKLNPDDSFNEIYALVTFHISQKKKGIKIHTLCGNQALPASGEGTRLLKLLGRVGKKFEYYKIVLNPVDTAIKYYTDNKFRFLKENDSRETSDSNESDSNKLVMQKNTRALKHWKKLQTAVSMYGILRKTRKHNEIMELQKKYLELAKEKEANRPIRLDPRTMRERATLIVPGASFENTRKFVPITSTKGTPSKVIVPGESFVLSNKKAEILAAAEKSRKEEVDQILTNLKKSKLEKSKKKSNKSGKGNKKTKKRRNA